MYYWIWKSFESNETAAAYLFFLKSLDLVIKKAPAYINKEKQNRQLMLLSNSHGCAKKLFAAYADLRWDYMIIDINLCVTKGR